MTRINGVAKLNEHIRHFIDNIQRSGAQRRDAAIFIDGGQTDLGRIGDRLINGGPSDRLSRARFTWVGKVMIVVEIDVPAVGQARCIGRNIGGNLCECEAVTFDDRFSADRS